MGAVESSLSKDGDCFDAAPSSLSLPSRNRSSATTLAISPPDLYEEISDAQLQRTINELAARENAYLAKAKNDAKANLSACFEDLICFLEMHGISGAYALAFSANGIESLSQLLAMEQTELHQVVEGCDLDAMDEILLK